MFELHPELMSYEEYGFGVLGDAIDEEVDTLIAGGFYYYPFPLGYKAETAAGHVFSILSASEAEKVSEEIASIQSQGLTPE